MMKPAGPELSRRWLACLLLVDREDRETLVIEVEKRVAALYGDHERVQMGEPKARELTVVRPAVQRDGYVERVETTYSAPAPQGATRKPAAKPRKRAK